MTTIHTSYLSSLVECDVAGVHTGVGSLLQYGILERAIGS